MLAKNQLTGRRVGGVGVMQSADRQNNSHLSAKPTIAAPADAFKPSI